MLSISREDVIFVELLFYFSCGLYMRVFGKEYLPYAVFRMGLGILAWGIELGNRV
jgi:hypothetical protein